MKAQRALSDEAERVRLDGLRILVRHALAHPEHYAKGSAEQDSPHHKRLGRLTTQWHQTLTSRT